MADSIFGDIAKTAGGVVSDSLGSGGGIADAVTSSGIADALGQLGEMVNGEGMQNVLHELEVSTAGLSEGAHDQVMEALPDLQVTDAADLEVQANQLIQDATEADAHRVHAQELQLEQAKAAESGDYEHAHELSLQAGYDLQAADDLGRESSHQVVEAQSEQMALGEADWHQEIADDNATSAASYADAGDYDNAAMYGEVAADHAATSYDYGSAGDHGGSYATPAADTSSVADTTSE